jgi:putative sigma-54 modulation protein
MNLNLTGRHLEITPAIRQHVSDKIAKIKGHFEGVMEVNVVLSVEKLRQKAEGSVHLSGKDVFVESENENLYVAIDDMVEEKFAARRHDDSSRA